MNSGKHEPSDDSREKWITIDRLCDAYEASLQDGDVERAPFLAGVPATWRDQLTHELDAIDAAYRDAEETREQTLKASPDEPCSRRLPTQSRLAELATLDSSKVWLGRFEIRKRLGTGATGSVWCARDARLARWVALKVPHVTRVMSETTAARFQNEARAAAAITHPNVVQVHEVLIEDGLPILIQQWIDGPSLAKYLKDNGRLGFDQAAGWMAQIADAVACAHEQGIVHRDLKPANVMLNDNRPMVLDFGLASYPQASSGLTSEGTILGTPAYMSPEQARGDEDASQPPTDLYALGVILYEMLSGTPPFVGKARDVLESNKSALPTPPSAHRKNLPRDLETIAMRCLAKSPTARYQSAAELRDDLQRYLRREPIRARKVSFSETAWVWCRLHPVSALLSAGIPLVLMLLLGLLTIQKRNSRLNLQTKNLVRVNQATLNAKERLREQRSIIELARASQELASGDRSRGLQLLSSVPESMRGWEWRLLDQMSHSPSRQLNVATPIKQSGATITSLATTRRIEGKKNLIDLFAAATDGTILRWRLPSGKEAFSKDRGKEFKFEPPELFYRADQPINGLAISPNGKWIAWTQGNGECQIWDLIEYEHHLKFQDQRFDSGYAVAFSPDSRSVIFGGGSRLQEVESAFDEWGWYSKFDLNEKGEFESALEIKTPRRPAVTSVKFMNGRLFYVARGSWQPVSNELGMVEQCRIPVDTETHRKSIETRVIWRGLSTRGLDVHRGTRQIAWCDDNGMAYVQGTREQWPLLIPAVRRNATQVRFTPIGDQIIVTADDGRVTRWNVGKPNEISRPATENSVAAEKPSTDQTEPPAGEDKVAVVAEPDQAKPDQAKPDGGQAGTKVDAQTKSPRVKTEQRKVTGPKWAPSRDAAIHLRSYHGHSKTVRDALFLSHSVFDKLANGQKILERERRMLETTPFLVTAGEDGKVLQWSHSKQPTIETTRLATRRLTDAAWISDRQLAASVSYRRSDQVGHVVKSMPQHEIDVDARYAKASISVTPDVLRLNVPSASVHAGRYAVCCLEKIYVCEAGNGTTVAEFEAPFGGNVDFTGCALIDSRYIVAGFRLKGIRRRAGKKKLEVMPPLSGLVLFDVQDPTRSPIGSIEHPGFVSQMRLSPDGRDLAVATRKGTLAVIRLKLDSPATDSSWAETLLPPYQAHPRAIRDLIWLSPTDQLATVSEDGTCSIWELKAADVTGQDTLLQDAADGIREMRRMVVSGNAIWRLSATSTGNRLATVGSDRIVRIWDTRSGLELISLEPRNASVVALQFSPDDRFLSIAESDGRIDVIRLME